MKETVYLSDEDKYSHIASEWHPSKNGDRTPDNTTSGSSLDIWWACQDYPDHEWKAKPLTRTRTNGKCPICMNKKLLSGFNDLAAVNPKLADEWHPTLNGDLKPSEIFPSTNNKAFWLGKECGHEWDASVNSRSKGNGCPFCGNRRVLKGFNDLASSVEFAKISDEWHPDNTIDPSQTARFSSANVLWKCEKGHEWKTSIANRTRLGSGCRKCSLLQKAKETGTVSDNKELLAEWHPDNERKANEVSLGSDYRALWQCQKNPLHVWIARVANRSRTKGCTVCSGHSVIEGVNDFSSQPEYKSLLEEWHPENKVNPKEITATSSTKVKWICQKGHVWEASVYVRAQKGHGCGECIGRSTWSNNKRKISDYPDLSSQWSSLNTADPSEVSFRSGKEFTWKCPKDEKHIWVASPASRNLDGSDCPVCAGRVVIAGVNDLLSSPRWKNVKNEWHPDNTVNPAEITPSSGKDVLWLCSRNNAHTWTAPIFMRVIREQAHCVHCYFPNNQSQPERNIKELLENMGIEVESNVRRVIKDRMELDLYLPDSKVGIEYNGLNWHTDEKGADARHIRKIQLCEEQGIKLHVIWEDDWRNNRVGTILNLAKQIGILDRVPDILPAIEDTSIQQHEIEKMECIEVDDVEWAKEFSLQNHPKYVNSDYTFALIDELEECSALLQIDKEPNNSGVFRIVNYVERGLINGGLNRILEGAANQIHPSVWSVDIDTTLDSPTIYEANGFIFDSKIEADYWYLTKATRVSRSDYTIKGFYKNPNLQYKDGLTERELAELNGLRRIYDYGKLRYIKEVK